METKIPNLQLVPGAAIAGTIIPHSKEVVVNQAEELAIINKVITLDFNSKFSQRNNMDNEITLDELIKSLSITYNPDLVVRAATEFLKFKEKELISPIDEKVKIIEKTMVDAYLRTRHMDGLKLYKNYTLYQYNSIDFFLVDNLCSGNIYIQMYNEKELKIEVFYHIHNTAFRFFQSKNKYKKLFEIRVAKKQDELLISAHKPGLFSRYSLHALLGDYLEDKSRVESLTTSSTAYCLAYARITAVEKLNEIVISMLDEAMVDIKRLK